MTIGELIHKRRIELGLTLEDIGNAVGVGKSTVKKWETGYISNMRRDKISLLADVLHVNPTIFINDSDAAINYEELVEPTTSFDGALILSDAETNMIEIFRSLNGEGQEKVLSYIDDLLRAGIYKKDYQSELGKKEA